MNGWCKFNGWSRITPITNESLQIYFNSGKGRQKNKSWRVDGRVSDLSKGADNALNAFFKQIKPDFKFNKSEFDFSQHKEPFKETCIGIFAVTDIARVGNKIVGADGLWLIKEEEDVIKLYDCNHFYKLEF